MGLSFSNGSIENRLHVVGDTTSANYWEMSVSETTSGPANRITRFGMAINRETGYKIGWKAFNSATSNNDVFELLKEEISGEIQIG